MAKQLEKIVDDLPNLKFTPLLHPGTRQPMFNADGQQAFVVTCESDNEAWYPVIEWRNADGPWGKRC